jgi:ABC-type nickel/cobalt efflux system permease component RcnA
MFGLDEWVAQLADGAGLAAVLAVALLLGLRHASDPDHLAAVSTLIASEPEDGTRRAGHLGLAWGLGHATTLALFGLPIVLFHAYLPDGVQRGAEALVGLMIMVLAARLLLRWRRGHFHAHPHRHGDTEHRHLHPHDSPGTHDHVHRPEARLGRSPTQA